MKAFKLSADEVTALSTLLPDEIGQCVWCADELSAPIGPVADKIAKVVTSQGWLEEALKTSLYAYAAAKRWQVETGGIQINGIAISTDEVSQSKISGAHQRASETGAVTYFKAASGFVELSAEQIKTIALAVGDHIQACFQTEKEIIEAIKSGQIKTAQQIDAYTWPGAS